MSVDYYQNPSNSHLYIPQISSNVEETSQGKKKRSRNPENWKKEKRKRAILSGTSYVNTKGEVVGPRSIGPDCNCNHRCFSSVSEENRKTIFNGYYSLKSYDEQNAYLYGLIRRYDIQRKRKPVSERRTCSYKYFVRIKGKEVQVCKKAFANIHGISDKKIRTLCIKHEQNILFPRDNRGRHTNRPKKVTPELVVLIKHHILKILSGPNGSDFIKTEKNQGPDVNISSLHKNFMQQYEPEALDTETGKILKNYDAKVKSWLYFKVFHEEFNSVDFHTVKRKLADLRRSLEANGSVQTKKKPTRSTKTTKPRTPNASKELHCVSRIPQQIAPCYPQQLPFSPLSLGMPPMTSHVMQPPFIHDGTPMQPTTDPRNMHQMSNNHPPSYYLCLGHVSNLISLSAASDVPTNLPSTTHCYPPQQQQQFAPSPCLMPHQSQSLPTVTNQHHAIHHSYMGHPHNHMY